MKKYKIVADLHTHTIFSLHGYSTVMENAQAAKAQGIKYLAVTDHYYGKETYPTDILVKNESNRIIRVADYVKDPDIIVIPGVELNIGQTPYHKVVEETPWRPVGFHSWFVDRENSTLKDVYKMFYDKISSGEANALAHIERELHKVDHGRYGDELTSDIEIFLYDMLNLAITFNIPLELNESSLKLNEGDCTKKIEFWLRTAKDYNRVIYLGTDSHICTDIGKFPLATAMLERVGYPSDLVINCNEELLNSMIINKA